MAAMKKKTTPSPPSSDKHGYSRGHGHASAGTKEISSVVLGEHLIQPWYSSAYPVKLVGDACSSNGGRLYVCEYCFKYTPDVSRALAHQKYCKRARMGPPGARVYQSSSYEIYEVDGAEEPLFCQSLCLFGKFFLDTKSICYETRSFLFYTLVESCPTTNRKRVLGFFSKEKISWDDYNLACILVFPPFQRRGLGKLLIAFSYELSRLDRKIGSPEKPLSDLGHKGYIAYWSSCLAKAIMNSDKDSISISELSKATYIQPDDIKVALDAMGVLVLDENGGAPHIQMDHWRQGVDDAYTIDSEGMFIRSG